MGVQLSTIFHVSSSPILSKLPLFTFHTSSISSLRIQKNAETKKQQFLRWREFILQYAKHRKQAVLNIGDDSELFVNEKINRRLDREARETIMNELCSTKNAAMIGKSTGTYEIYWLTLEEWSNALATFATNNGLTSSVLTVFELLNEYPNEEFHQLNEQVLLRALRQLESKGKCEVMDINGSYGVKFF